MTEKTSIDKIINEKKILLLVVVGIVLSWVVFGPIVTKLRSRISDSKKLTGDYQKLSGKLEILESIDAPLIEKRVKKMEEVFPSKKPVVQLMGALSSLSGEHSLSFGGVTLRPGVLGEEKTKKKKKTTKKKASSFSADLKDMKFGFEVAGDYDQIAKFMSDLEHLAPLMKIEEISLTVKSNPFLEGASLSVIADIEVASYYQLPPKSLGSIGTPVKLLDREDEVYLNRLFSFKTYETVIPVAPTGKVDLFSSGLGEEF